ncbi:MAG: glutamate-5-semialdehyde dehydrogenase [Candidatus Gastranaerophilales bacterium]|nr:glutamate-5-semialdehyde dehydrogenase [Candidatus Gastranaerophilales bacterium]
MSKVKEIAENAKRSSVILSALDTELKNKALLNVAEALKNNTKSIIDANNKDLEAAKEAVISGKLSKAVFNRLKADENKIKAMIDGIYDVIKLDDPVNKILFTRELADGLILKKVSCPIGVIGVIFEARPDVLAQISALAIKSGNAVLLKGGKETTNTNSVMFGLINDALKKTDGFPDNIINLLFTHDDVKDMLSEDKSIDLIIPRGSNNLVRYIQENTKIPVLGHASGICHIFADESADFEKALRVIEDAKCQYPAACNAVETILIHKNIANEFLPLFLKKMKALEVKVNGDEVCRKIDDSLGAVDDWSFEYGEKELSVKIVDSLEDAVKHINTYGSGHTDCILTENTDSVKFFMDRVDSAGVYHNVSTRFSDGCRYGFGAEVGISTNKTHARGPVGLDGLTIYKYQIFGNGDIVSEFCSGERKFTHKDL